ncbi:PREDICTED: uncharacterized protein LOC108567921 isoform X5 [Nicrophorus vespilloides]|uniref:Uncharacterized protein LOC108567921 isoform X5 n=1 Tax=Nicrophorus vespilloides TaxID=110193 RepID=A0ABM1NBL3_NICVS|nr:PREDICTED: uncharacterized protein LOC108567921 isoform X5 [Nicrophorus vespilloides]
MDSRQTLSRGEHIGDSSTSSCGVFSWERVHSKNCPYFHSERSDAVLETWKLAKSVSTCKQLHMA